MNALELHQLVNEISMTYFNKPFKDCVAFNERLRTTGGRYLPSKRKIELNSKFLTELGMEEFKGIIKHELCHYHLHIEGKGYKHGDREFRQLLKKTGSPRHCQPLPTMQNQTLLTYKCSGCNQRYNRRRRIDTNKYRCGKCSGKLKKEI
ncbi:Protein SprT-like protein [Paraliobacillus sp. PM-2]|uniref:SprT family protein n=1 Tax=Paraliobacillus sp. PM-2 TaxID=1462524 RepID=UPI00061B8ED2|nr:SprT family protein [Paraliobacillus sp. PM-2]CQR48257.1 Protein SprT-like protein [Paraliobacillus sp. PM-2]